MEESNPQNDIWRAGSWANTNSLLSAAASIKMNNGSSSSWDALDYAANFAAGWGDTLSFGITDKIRDFAGINDGIDKNSWTYLGGVALGTLHQIAMSAGGGGASVKAPSCFWQCFAKDTPVWTSQGPKAIGEIKPGERVRAYHFEYGEWVHATVTDRSEHNYKGPVVTVEVGGSKIETTIYHPFWVVEGQNLDERPVPKELLAEEDEGNSLKGRWVNSHDLRAGDKIYLLSGKLETITSVSQRHEDRFIVCNLTIEDLHNYAVGLCGVLVHNGGCGYWASHLKTMAQQVGNTVKAAAPTNMIRPHAHHIVMRIGLWGRGYVNQSKAILARAGIGIDDLENMCWARNWDHSRDYAKAVYVALKKVDGLGKEEVARTLQRIADILKEGRRFRGF